MTARIDRVLALGVVRGRWVVLALLFGVAALGGFAWFLAGGFGEARANPGQSGYSQGWDQRALGSDPSRPSVTVGPFTVAIAPLRNASLSVPGPSFASVTNGLSVGAVWNSAPSGSVPTQKCSDQTDPGCQPDRNYSGTAPRTAGFGAGFTLNVGDGSTYVAKLVDHGVLAPDPPDPFAGMPGTVGAPVSTFVEVVYSDGGNEFFEKSGSQDVWLPSTLTVDPESATPTTVDTTDGRRLVRNPAAAGTIADPFWTLTDADGTVSKFGVTKTAAGVGQGDALLLETQRETKLSGTPVSLQYTSQTVGSDLFVTSIKEVQGATVLRTITLTWNATNAAACATAILCVTGPDNQQWKYVGDLTGGTTGKLTRVFDGTRNIVEYGWTGANITSAKNANDLDPTGTNISPGFGSTHRWEAAYDASGRVTTVTEQGVNISGALPATPATTTFSEFVALDGTNGNNGCNAFEKQTQDHPGGVLAGVPRSGCWHWFVVNRAGTDADTYDQWFVTDRLGRLQFFQPKLTNPQGGWHFGYTGDGRLLWSEDPDGRSKDYTYDDRSKRLLQVQLSDPDGAGPLGRPTTKYRYDERQVGSVATAGTAVTGLREHLFKNANLQGIPDNRALDNTASVISESYGTTGPAQFSPAQGTNYSVRWSGLLNIATAGAYAFQVTAEDGVRFYLDDQPLMVDWQNTTGSRVLTADSTTASVLANVSVGLHRVTLEYFHDATGSGSVALSWKLPGAGSFVAVPLASTFPDYGNQTSIVSPTGRISFSHFADGESGKADYTLEGAPALRLVASYTYDAFGRPTQKVQPKGNTARTINASGALAAPTGTIPDPKFITSYTYYAATANAAPPTACGQGSTTVNQSGQLKTLAPSGLTSTTFVYDVTGRTIAKTNAKGTRCWKYTPEGRLDSERTPTDPVVSSCTDTSATACYSYDPAGLLRVAKNTNGNVTIVYNEASQVIAETQRDSANGIFGDSTIRYNARGELRREEIAPGQIGGSGITSQERTYGWSNGRLTGVGSGAGPNLSITYDRVGNLCVLAFDNWFHSQSLYTNPAGWQTLSTVRHNIFPSYNCNDPNAIPADSNPIVEYNRSFDLDGRVTSETRTGGNGLATEARSYTYDTAGRISTATLPNLTQRAYAYDEDSNRLTIKETPNGGSQQTIATSTFNNTTNPGIDELTSILRGAVTTTYAYDGDGNTLSYGPTTLGWDGRGRMKSAQITSSTGVTYLYDALGRLQSRTTTNPVTTRKYVFAGTGGSAVLETDGSNAVQLLNREGPLGVWFRVIGDPSSGTKEHVWPNLHGDLGATSDDHGNRTAAFTYDEFGNPDQALPANSASERWTGQYRKQTDSVSGLTLMGARPLDSSTGRFSAVDPIEGGSASPYDFCNGDPLNCYDLSGEGPQPPCLGTRGASRKRCMKIYRPSGGGGSLVRGLATAANGAKSLAVTLYEHPAEALEAADGAAELVTFVVGGTVLTGVCFAGVSAAEIPSAGVATPAYLSCAALAAGTAVVAVQGTRAVIKSFKHVSNLDNRH